ncbi:unnamed protein product [Dibothriocephalus latus]|uniref:Uncharacterized protein n=1 Tax=Dibothriocephalus latus TaxID=60516 RepID=A0A3P7P6M6_DIBLA|nr:unnamed protein product [Dibothriocephalus latus]
MSALSILLVLLMLSYVFYKNNRTTAGGAHATRHRRRTDRRGHRRIRNDRQSVGVQAEQLNLAPDAVAANSGLNTGFHDSEALLGHEEGLSMVADEENERDASTRHSSGNTHSEPPPPTPTGPPPSPPGVLAGTEVGVCYPQDTIP